MTSFVSIPHSSSFRSLLPHVIVTNDVSVLDISNVPADIDPFRSVFRDTFGEQGLLFFAKLWLFQILVEICLFQTLQCTLNIELFGVKILESLVQEVCVIFWKASFRRHVFGFGHVFVDEFLAIGLAHFGCWMVVFSSSRGYLIGLRQLEKQFCRTNLFAVDHDRFILASANEARRLIHDPRTFQSLLLFSLDSC
jgi:hypothetical protein